MNDPDLDRLLTDALTEHARAAVPDERPVPQRAPTLRVAPTRRHAWLAPLAAAAAVVTIVGGGVALRADHGGDHSPAAGPTAGATTSPALSAEPGAKPVAIAFDLTDASVVGVGMPVLAHFSTDLTDARALQAATQVTVNGTPVDAQWYLQPRAAASPMSAVLRPRQYWPAHASVRVDLTVKGLSGGHGLGFAADASLSFTTGPSDIATVDAHTHLLTLVRDGQQIAVYPVSLGAPTTPTSRGIKVITARGASICQSGPTYNECGIKDTQQVAASGEYLLGAPWNVANIGTANTTNGSTDLLPADAAALFGELRIGDIVYYPNVDGPLLPATVGGYWNVGWTTWQTGGAIRTH